MINSRTNITSKHKDIQNVMLGAIRDHFAKGFKKQIRPIEDVTRSIIKRAILDSGTTHSLLRGYLSDYFGISTSTAKTIVSDLVDNITDKIKVSYSIPSTGNLIAEINILFLSINVEQLDNISKYISVGRYGGGEVHPLHDLLMIGTQVKIPFAHTKADGKTRSGGDLVEIPAKNKEPHRIPPGHAGTPEDNFLTRAALSNADKLLEKIIPLVLESF
ncbi:MAG: hypothetical protein P8M80_02065 [Pirellulaceae bacterium]|nr:hypothetical protein [Pirellulaceae bacterium]